MFKMIIESDPVALKRNGLDANEFDSFLRDICLDTKFKESSPNHYYLEEDYDELGRMLVLDVKFEKIGYIIPNLKTWLTYSDEEGEVDQLI